MRARTGIAIVFGVFGLLACSEAETPNANNEAGPPPPGADAGDGAETGDRDEPCNANNTCNNANTLACVNDLADDVAKCRLICDPDADPDPCGAGQSCIGLVDAGDSVCAPPRP